MQHQSKSCLKRRSPDEEWQQVREDCKRLHEAEKHFGLSSRQRCRAHLAWGGTLREDNDKSTAEANGAQSCAME